MEEHIKPEELTVSEADERVQRAVNYLEEQLNRINETPGERDQRRHEDLSSVIISLLAEECGILPPTDNEK